MLNNKKLIPRSLILLLTIGMLIGSLSSCAGRPVDDDGATIDSE
jgi:hypothetical protein